nr:hypothetical protein [Burkholderia mayonis]
MRYCLTSLPRLNARPLFAEHFLPVCPPQYLRELGDVSTADDLLRARLIHALWFLNNHHENSSWDDWFAIAGGASRRLGPYCRLRASATRSTRSSRTAASSSAARRSSPTISPTAGS